MNNNVSYSYQQQSLLAFRSSITQDPQNSLANWTPNIALCNWSGIACDEAQERVLSISLKGMNLKGPLSSHIADLSILQSIDLSGNALHGPIPPRLGSLYQLRHLSFRRNRLEGTIPSSLGNLSALRHLDLGVNKLSGYIPCEIGNLTNLKLLDLSTNHLNGTIPSLGRLQNLEMLFLQKNRLVGTIPDDVGRLNYLRLLNISHNMLSGRIPESIGKMQQLKWLFLHHNHLSDIIPCSLGYCKHLQLLDLSHNSLTGGIPEEVANLSGINFYLNLSYNFLDGLVPKAIGNLVLAEAVDISRNRLTGVIPDTLGNCTALKYLNLSRNSIQGTIPYSLGNLPNLAHLDLSFNSLSGAMPTALKKLASLRSLDISFNGLAGDIDEGGSFANSTTAVSLVGNSGLCGSIVPSLPACGGKRTLKITALGAVAAVAGVTALILVSSLSALMLLLRLMWKWVFNQSSQSGDVYPSWARIERISYHEILIATDGLSEANLLGRSNFGSVYKGTLSDGQKVAVKVLDLTNEESDKSFKAECEVSRQVRHRNLTKIITICYNVKFKGIVFPFVCNRSLETQLHPCRGSCQLGLVERLNIAIDVAHAMEYLHHECPVQVVHCDIKPSNVLLDEHMTAYVTDFGIARLLGKGSQTSLDSVHLKGTTGYTAPEYGLTAKVSTKGDVYSYGILLLEMFTGKRPTDDMFEGGLNLHTWVDTALFSRADAVIDGSLTTRAVGNHIRSIVALLHIGLLCSKYSPQARPSMKHVTTKLNIIRGTLTLYFQTISHDDIVIATDNFSEANLLGINNFGSVFKGTLSDGQNVSVKVLDLPIEDVDKSFQAECKVYRRVQHPNLTKIISICYNINIRAIVFPFFRNGSLEAHLHPCRDGDCQLGLKERLNIAIDIAHAMEYLHHECPVQVVHCDLKPINVLLDEHMIAYVTNFGIATVLGRGSQTSLDSLHLKGTAGYIAPEYAWTKQVSTEGDVYSYGILLVEMFTGKRPTDAGGLNLHRWMHTAVKLELDTTIADEEIDESLSTRAVGNDIRYIKELLHIGFLCSKHVPQSRPTMKDVTTMLKKIRVDFRYGQRDFTHYPERFNFNVNEFPSNGSCSIAINDRSTSDSEAGSGETSGATEKQDVFSPKVLNSGGRGEAESWMRRAHDLDAQLAQREAKVAAPLTIFEGEEEGEALCRVRQLVYQPSGPGETSRAAELKYNNTTRYQLSL